jgi:hypothetical protein
MFLWSPSIFSRAKTAVKDTTNVQQEARTKRNQHSAACKLKTKHCGR